MERKYAFYTKNGLQYTGWFAREDMATFSMGMAIGMRAMGRKRIEIKVFEVDEEYGKESLVRIQN